jgi:pyruvate dehydrogenase E2 component (dihydrolipoamide acetyltransferase)
MPTRVLMPALSPTMTEGKIARWLKKEGDAVKSGDVLAEIETDKATMEVEAVDEGKLGKILVPGGTEAVKVNTPIAVILGEDENASALANISAEAPPSAPAAAPKPAAAPASSAPPAPAPKPAPAAGATPLAQRMAQQAGIDLSGVAGTGPGGKVMRRDISGPGAGGNGAAPAGDHEGRIFASPLARRLAQQAGIDLSRIAASGPHGRIVKADVEAAVAHGGATAPAARPAGAPAPSAPSFQARPAPAPTGPTPYHVVPHTTMRKVIAKRLTEAKQTVPHYYLTVDCEIDTLLKGRAALNAQAPEKGEGAYKLSVNDFVIKAVAMALRQVPTANASWSDDGIVMYDRADISVAVAIPGGLITPIIVDAANKGLIQISNEMKDLAQKAKNNKLKPEEFQGGTFSISNLGMYGTRQFAAVINPPQGGIIAVGAGEQRPVVKNGALAVATVMSCTLSADHRVIDGAIGAEFMAAFKKLIEEPLGMLL